MNIQRCGANIYHRSICTHPSLRRLSNKFYDFVSTVLAKAKRKKKEKNVEEDDGDGGEDEDEKRKKRMIYLWQF